MNIVLIVGLIFIAYYVVAGSRHGIDSAASELPHNVVAMNSSQLRAALTQSKEPTLLFLYASWCPYCKKQVEVLRAIKREKDFPIIGLSIDQSVTKFSSYVSDQQALPFTPYIYAGPDSLIALLEERGIQFEGGIPYLAIFVDGKLRSASPGLTQQGELEALLKL